MTNAQKKSNWKARTQVWKNVASAQVITFFPFSDNKCFVLTKFVLWFVDIIRSLTPLLRKVWCNVIRIQHIFNNPLSFLGLLVLSIWKSVYNRWTVCVCADVILYLLNRWTGGYHHVSSLPAGPPHDGQRARGVERGGCHGFFHLRLISRGFFALSVQVGSVFCFFGNKAMVKLSPF